MKNTFSKSIYLLLVILIFFIAKLLAQVTQPAPPETFLTTYYLQRTSLFKSLPVTKNETIFLGNSITDGSEWSQLFNDVHCVNQGISGDITAGVIHRLNLVTDRKPPKVFLLIGTNDLAHGIAVDSALKNILLIVDYIHQQSPLTKLFVQSILPVNPIYKKFSTHTDKTKQINLLNTKLKELSGENRYTYIDLYSFFADRDGLMNPKLTNDGLHLLGDGYALWKHIIFPFVYGLTARPSLIPKPQQIKWDNGFFPLYKCHSILVNNNTLQNESNQLQQFLQSVTGKAIIVNNSSEESPSIELRISKVNTPLSAGEAYRLKVTPEKILIEANTSHGIFNGIQTLIQLARDKEMIDACEITDWPAFAWRGYMIDVGRNYMPMDLLKQQIEIMGRYKLNVFHFHSTEDIAWRFGIKAYPQLTSASTMLRNAGEYYTSKNIQELIQYCKERHITFVPEIDMPGHSAAFKRAMGTDMQSESGITILKHILNEICKTYDVPYIHIGADEVKITNEKFIPEITQHIESFGKKVIGWQPGGNFTNNTIRQLWMDDNAHLSKNKQTQFIDSRHLYLNHMDPLESTVTIFNREIGDVPEGNSEILGATLCTWNDRRASEAIDILRMNPVYPGMLTFSERCWRGGGRQEWISNVNDGDAESFKEFEHRLLDQKKLFFKGIPFPYVRQTQMQWRLYGPYNNNGNLSKKFEPELSNNTEQWKFYKEETGGTIVLRHWWYPLIKAAVDSPKENSTIYAYTKIWSDEPALKNFWIGFYDPSRSTATDTPPENGWDYKQSKVWVNGQPVAPPDWEHAGQKGDSEVPLVDEGYSYREPTKILLKKGWNDVLLKCPVGTFKGRDWQNPVKWMFTFVPLDGE